MATPFDWLGDRWARLRLRGGARPARRETLAVALSGAMTKLAAAEGRGAGVAVEPINYEGSVDASVGAGGQEVIGSSPLIEYMSGGPWHGTPADGLITLGESLSEVVRCHGSRVYDLMDY